MVAIQTKYLNPTSIRGSRYKAFTDCQSITVTADDRLDSESNHKAVATALCQKMKWSGYLVEGHTSTGFVFVFLPNELAAACDLMPGIFPMYSVIKLPEVKCK